MSTTPTNPTIVVAIDGEECRWTVDHTRERVRDLTREAMLADGRSEDAERERIRRFVRWGVVLMQVRPQIGEMSFREWLVQAGCTHRQKAYGAIALAAELADTQGVLDEARLLEKIRIYNRDCAGRDGCKTLSEGSRSIRTAMAACHLRPGPKVRGEDGSVRRAGHSELVGAGGEPAHGGAHGGKLDACDDSMFVQMVQTYIGQGVESANRLLNDGDRARARELGIDVPTEAMRDPEDNDCEADVAAATAMVEGEGASPVLRAEGHQQIRIGDTRSLRSGLVGDGAPRQLSLADEYALAEEMRAVAGMVEAGSVSAADLAELRRVLKRVRGNGTRSGGEILTGSDGGPRDGAGAGLV